MPTRSLPSVRTAWFAAFLSIGIVCSAQGQEFPNKQVRLVVPFAAGGGTDILARDLAPKLGEILGGFLGSLYAVAPDQLDQLARSGPLTGMSEFATIQRSELGDDRLMIGAAELAFEPVLSDPSSFRSGD